MEVRKAVKDIYMEFRVKNVSRVVVGIGVVNRAFLIYRFDLGLKVY